MADRFAVKAGLAVLDAVGDFAAGVIACEGRWLGGDVFVSVDQKAVTRIEARGKAAVLLS
jgi:hypothetical protein